MPSPRPRHLTAVPTPKQVRREPLWREAVGSELRAARQAADRTLAEVAEQAGVSMQYLSEVERGTKEPSSEVVRAVCGALGLRLVELTVRVSRSLAGTQPVPRGPVCLAA
jgi:DNA-binding XRE family transcriptional regulator